jgi:glyoxylase-like metal-dependent hydrolase (beta-lactamase superfamily II)
MPLDFYIWAMRSERRTMVVDTGFGPEMAIKRNRRLLRAPASLLRAIGIDPGEVSDVVLTHTAGGR